MKMFNAKIYKLFVLFFALFIFPICLFAAGSVSISKSSLSIDEGKTATFNIAASNAKGNVKISSNDTSIATVDKSNEEIENGTLKVTVTGVKEGKTEIVVEIEATTDEEEINTTKKIPVTVSLPKSSINNLLDLKINGVTVSGFSSSKTSYSYSADASSIEISAEKEDPNSTVSGTGTRKLDYGSNKLNVKVTAENGNVKTYTITVNRKDDRNTNNDLKDLKIDDVTLSGFSPSKTSYTISSEKTSINITATAEDTKATVSGTGTKTIKKGSNKFTIKVTAENETVKTYTLVVNNGVVEEEKKDDKTSETDIVEYTLKYDDESLQYCPTGTIATITTKENEMWGKLCEPEKEGYVFNGWYTKDIGGEAITEKSIAREDITIYAHWGVEIVKDRTVQQTSTGLNPTVIVVTAILSFILGGLVSFFILRKRFGTLDE